MKKIYSIGAIVLTGVTLVAYLFGKIDTVTFGTITGMIATTLFGLYQKFEKGEVIKENLKLKLDIEDIASSLRKEYNHNQELRNKLYTEEEVLKIAEDQVMQVKKTRNKKSK